MKTNQLRLKSLIINNGWKLVPLALLVIVVGISEAYPMKLIQRIVDIAVGKGAATKIPTIIELGAVYIGVFIVAGVARYALNTLYRILQAERGHQLRSRIWEHALNLRPLPLSGASTNDVVMNALKDSEIATTNFMRPVVNILQSVTQFAIGLVIMLSIDWQMTLFVFPLGLFSAALTRRTGGRMRSLASEVRNQTTAMWSLFAEVMRGLKDVQTNNGTEEMRRKLIARSAGTTQATIQDAIYNERTESLNRGFFMAVIGLIMTFGAVLISEGKLSIGGLTAFMMYNGMLVDPVVNFLRFYSELQAIRVSIGRLNALFDYPTFPERVNPALLAGSQGGLEVEIRDVWFAFESHRPVLKGVNLRIDAGEHIAIVGPSGCGKTTLTHLIAGIYAPDSGEVSVGGATMAAHSPSTIRPNVAVVMQDPYLFNATIEENVKLGVPDATSERVAYAVRLAGMADHWATAAHAPQASVGEGGSRLSGGERQRVALARAFVRDPSVIILDEGTSALDSTMSRMVLEQMLAEFTEKTILVIAHKISSIVGFPRIVVMVDGEIVGDGRHEQLLKGCALYARLYANQFADETV